MKLIKLLFASTFMLFAAMVLALLASPVAANDVVEICHVPPKTNQTEPFATGRIIEIPREDCEDHCIDHGGDHVMGDGACAAAVLIRNQCIVNSPEPGCSIERCIGFCTDDCPCFDGIADDTPYSSYALSAAIPCPEGSQSDTEFGGVHHFLFGSDYDVAVRIAGFCDGTIEYSCEGGPAGTFTLSQWQYEQCDAGPGWPPIPD
jgi:hypothetical protein